MTATILCVMSLCIGVGSALLLDCFVAAACKLVSRVI